MPTLDLLNPIRKEIAALRSEPNDRIALYRRGLGRVESRPDVLGGEPVFKGARLSVGHIGGMVLSGVPEAEIGRRRPGESRDPFSRRSELLSNGNAVPTLVRSCRRGVDPGLRRGDE